ncbi:glycosyltransferase [Flagellimonas okinawensis]|uniref:Glycosyltransferase n=1 Tax=Flagellimonas okinawensis TaxID=3031324 RepID=A0ABT5XR12_9FLAO|nr:glycosyltransferase [[Muricauda] okinawensis]MDF0708334.1 glycosyltransferase [[Muricauda] okinawensis]
MIENPKKKVCFVLPSLGAGGAERVVSYVAQEVDSSKFISELLVIGFEKDNRYEIKGIKVHFLNEPRVLTSIPKLFGYLRKNNPDIVLSAIGHLNTIMALISPFFRKTKFIGREVNVLSVLKNYSTTSKKRLFPVPNYIKLSYPLLDKIVCQSNDMANDLITNYNISPEKISVINNPITADFKLKEISTKPHDYVFKLITVGRLAKQKGHPRILEALSKLKIPFHYTIIGDGPEKGNIFEIIENLDLSEHITHVPHTNKVSEYLCENDVFIQGSYVEGFPNALLESCAVGTPVVAFKALGGIDEIVVDGVNGYIAEDVEDFSNKITRILSSLNQWEPSVVSDSVYKKYSPNVILAKYNELLESI